MKFRKEFLGLDGFQWWFGVVENRQDPLGLGRCQVRIFGFHSESFSDIPSEDLPWAHPVHSLNNQTFSTPKEGDYVFGFFADGKFAQSPVMVGIVPGVPINPPDPTKGFGDVRPLDEIAVAPKKPVNRSYADDGNGVTVSEANTSNNEVLQSLRYPQIDYVGEPTNSRLARNENIKDTLIQDRRESLVSVTTATSEWKEPFPAYSAEYPYNKVVETESGHIFEMDDTPRNERIHLAHRSGSFQEWYPSGTKVEKIVRNNYQIVLSDDHLYVTGKVSITVGSDADIKVTGDANIQALNDVNLGVAGDAKFTVGGDFKVKARGIFFQSSSAFNVKSGSTINNQASGAINILAAGAVNIDGSDVRAELDAASGASGTGLGSAPAIGTPTSAPLFLELTPADRATFFLDAGETGLDEYIAEQVNKGVYTQEQIDQGNNPTEGEADQNTAPNLAGTTNCDGIENLSSFPDSLKLSNSFTLGQLSGQAPCGDPLREQRGLTKGQIVCNLKLLAQNCLDPIKARYPTALVTNAFRYPTGKAAGKSQHEIGQAADIQFSGISKSEYYNIALWIRDNVPHDQLLLEYKTFGSGLPWIHISFNKDGNRTAGLKNATFMNHRNHKPYFVNLA